MQKRNDLNEVKSFDVSLDIKNLSEDTPGVFEGYGSVFGNIDRDGDIMAKGAFADSLKKRMPKLLWQHNAKEPIGKFIEVREDENGLYVKGQLSMVGRGAEAYELLKMDALGGMSVGFITKQASRDHGTGRRTIMQAELMEVSLVTFPANEMATITSVKSYSDFNFDMDTKSEDTEYEKDGVIVFDAVINKAAKIMGFLGGLDAEENIDNEIADINEIYKAAGFAPPFDDGYFIDVKMAEKLSGKDFEKALRIGARFSRDAAKILLSQREVEAEQKHQREAGAGKHEAMRALSQLKQILTKQE